MRVWVVTSVNEYGDASIVGVYDNAAKVAEYEAQYWCTVEDFEVE